MRKLNLLPLLFSLTLLPLPARADAIQQTLNQQQKQIQDLNRMLQVQANQRQIESLQQQLNPKPARLPEPPPNVVVVEKERPSNGVGVAAGLILGTVLTNSSLNCYGGRCSYGYNAPYYRRPYYPRPYYRRPLPGCSWGTGYLGCR